MSLPLPWVDRIFSRMLVRYGVTWIRMWENVDPDALKFDWSEQLDRLPFDAITYGLEHLPDGKPPTVGQFKTLCLNRPPPRVKRLGQPEADKALAARALAQMKALRERTKRDAWAAELREREQRGERLTLAQKAAWRDAERVMPSGPSEPLKFNPIPVDMLPPGMRS